MRRTVLLLVSVAGLVLASCGDTQLVAPRLTVSVEGAGRVTSVPEGIDCPGHCEATFASETSVTLVAVPESGLAEPCFFVDDSPLACGGGCGKSCFVMMGPDREVVAEFQ